jgi:transcriptional regulator with XRE-family HTH domain
MVMNYTFAELLASFRRRAGLKQEQLADALGRSRTTVSNWERGVTLPEDRAIFRVLRDELSLSKPEIDLLMKAADYLPNHDLLHTKSDEFEGISERIIYESNVEVPPFISWRRFSTVAGHHERINVIRRPHDSLPSFEIMAYSTEYVGVHRNLATVHGKVVFEYKLISSSTKINNILFYVIPVKETWQSGKPEPMELGEDIPGKQLSYRSKLSPTFDHIGDGRWHEGTLHFDYREISSVNYCIFAPRINEGCSEHGAAHFLTSNIRVMV